MRIVALSLIGLSADGWHTEVMNKNALIIWNISNEGGISDMGNILSRERPAFIGLGHELGHFIDPEKNDDIWFIIGGQTIIDKAEIKACIIENQLRLEHGLPYRTHYSPIIRSDKSIVGGFEPSKIPFVYPNWPFNWKLSNIAK